MGHMRIVLVEDEPELCALLCDILQDDGYDVLPFGQAAPVLGLREIGMAPDLVLVDIMLPDMDGITLAHRLQEAGFRNTPMVAMSASPSMLQLATDSHLFVRTLSKPFDIDALLGCVMQSVAATRQSAN